MKFPFRTQLGIIPYLKHSRLAQVLFGVSFLLVALMIVLPLWRLLPIVQSDPFIPLHYNIYVGIDRFGPWWNVFILPVLGLIFIFANMALASLFSGQRLTIFGRKEAEPVLSRFFLVITPVLNLILAVAMTLIILLNV